MKARALARVWATDEDAGVTSGVGRCVKARARARVWATGEDEGAISCVGVGQCVKARARPRPGVTERAGGLGLEHSTNAAQIPHEPR